MADDLIKILIGADIDPSIDQILKDLKIISKRINAASEGKIKFVSEVDIQEAEKNIKKLQDYAKKHNIDLNTVADISGLLQQINKGVHEASSKADAVHVGVEIAKNTDSTLGTQVRGIVNEVENKAPTVKVNAEVQFNEKEIRDKIAEVRKLKEVTGRNVDNPKEQFEGFKQVKERLLELNNIRTELIKNSSLGIIKNDADLKYLSTLRDEFEDVNNWLLSLKENDGIKTGMTENKAKTELSSFKKSAKEATDIAKEQLASVSAEIETVKNSINTINSEVQKTGNIDSTDVEELQKQILLRTQLIPLLEKQSELQQKKVNIGVANSAQSEFEGVQDNLLKINTELDKLKQIESSIKKQTDAVRELINEYNKIEDPLKTSRNRDMAHVEKYGEDGSRTLEQEQAIKATLEEKERVLLRINAITQETPDALPIEDQKKYNSELESTRIYLEQVNSVLQNSQPYKPFIQSEAEKTTSINQTTEALKEQAITAKNLQEFISSGKDILQTAGLIDTDAIEKFFRDTKYELRFTPSEMDIQDAIKIIKENLSYDLMSGWYGGGNKSYKTKIEDIALSNDEVRNAGLNIAWDNYKKFVDETISYSDFLLKEIEVFRGKTHDEKYLKGDQILSYSFDKKIAEMFGSKITTAMVRPIETIGSYNVRGIGEGKQESEIFLRNEKALKKYELTVLSSLNIIKSAYSEYYASLNDESKKQLDREINWSAQRSKTYEKSAEHLEKMFGAISTDNLYDKENPKDYQMKVSPEFGEITKLIEYLTNAKNTALEAQQALLEVKTPTVIEPIVKTDTVQTQIQDVKSDLQSKVNGSPVEIPVVLDDNLTQNATSVLNSEEINPGTQAVENQIEAVRELDNALDEIGNNESRGLEFGIGVPEDERTRIISWFEEIKSTAENIQSISISPKFEVEDNEKTLVGYVATVKQLDDETKRIESSVINLNAELGDADGSWNRFTETVKSSTNAAKEFNAEFQKELATQQIDTLKAKLGELPFDFGKVEEASKNIVDKKSLESFNNELTLTKERIKTAQAEVKNENSLSAFTAMEKNLERIPTRIEVLEERVKRFASVEGFDKVSSDIAELHSILEKVNTAKANGDISETTKTYDELTSAISRVKEQMLLLGARKQSGNLSPVSNETTLEIQALFDLLKNADTKFNTTAGKTSEAKAKVDDLVAAFRELNKEGVDSKLISNFKDLAKILEKKFEFGLSDDGLKQNQEFIKNFIDKSKEITGIGKLINDEQFNDAKGKLKELEALKVSLSEMGLDDKQLGQISDVFSKAKAPVEQYTKDVENAEKGISDLILKFEAFKLKASAAVVDPTLGPTIKKLGEDLYAAQGKATPEVYNQLSAAFRTVDLSAKAVGKNVLSMVDLITQGFKKLGSYMINRVFFNQLQNSLSMIYKNVVDLEFAMKDLERISGISGSQMSAVFDRAAESAIKLGVSVKDVLGSLGEFSRLGMDIESSFELMNAATLLSTTGVMSLERSTKGLISATQAYGISAKDTMQLVDEIIATDISNAISAEGILDILERSSASLASTGSTIQTNIALGTALQSVLQNSEKAGTALNRITQRLRSTTGALQELGETDLEGTFTSITRLQERIYELTNYKVDIMLDKDTFKDVADIIREIGQVLPTLTDIQTAEIVQILGGAQQAQAASALLNQYHLIDESLEAMGASAGVAQKMNDVMLDSAKMKSEQLGASFEKLSQSAIDTTFIKGGLDGLRGLVEIITTINKSTGGLLSAGVALNTLVAGFKALSQKFDFSKTFQGIGKNNNLCFSYRFLGIA